jgi:DNA invertase Pin-like site-specific DNA recombinase
LLVEKTDRLYRNLKDWVTIDELGVELHFPKEGVVLSRESRSSEKFMHGIKVLMAKNYIDNLAEEARKEMQEKAEQGIWPTKTPLGYRKSLDSINRKLATAKTDIARAMRIEIASAKNLRFARRVVGIYRPPGNLAGRSTRPIGSRSIPAAARAVSVWRTTVRVMQIQNCFG